jgi:hypothetical protein
MVSSHRGRGVLHVADRATGKVLFTQDLDDEWFEHGLTSRAVWAATHAAPTSRGTRVEAELETKSDDNGQVLGWSVTLSSGGTPFFRRAWSTDVLRATAAVVARQCRGTHGDGQVLYWVHCGDADADPIDRSPIDGIEFDAGGDHFVAVPAIQTRPTAVVGRVVVPAAAYPTQIVLELSGDALAELASGIGDERLADKELAWAGRARIWRVPNDDAVVYQVPTLRRLAAPDASALLCPISPEEIIDLLESDAPIVFIHTHITPAGDTPTAAADPRLACSQDDLRSFHRLPVGSLGVVAASRSPLRMRVYGWPTNGDELAEMTTTVALSDEVRSVDQGESTHRPEERETEPPKR